MAEKPRFRRRTVFAKNLGFGVGFRYRNNTTPNDTRDAEASLSCDSHCLHDTNPCTDKQSQRHTKRHQGRRGITLLRLTLPTWHQSTHWQTVSTIHQTAPGTPRHHSPATHTAYMPQSPTMSNEPRFLLNTHYLQKFQQKCVPHLMSVFQRESLERGEAVDSRRALFVCVGKQSCLLVLFLWLTDIWRPTILSFPVVTAAARVTTRQSQTHTHSVAVSWHLLTVTGQMLG